MFALMAIDTPEQQAARRYRQRPRAGLTASRLTRVQALHRSAELN
jgi:hypothetical protein